MKTVFGNIFFLYIVQIVRLLIPLLLMPLVAHRVDSETIGLYMFTTSFASWISLFLEYGFNIFATREVSENVSNRSGLLKIASSVNSAKSILIFIVLPLCMLLGVFLPIYHGENPWLISMCLSAIFIGCTPLYYFQGIERLRLVALIEVISGVMLFCLIFFIVQTENDRDWLAYSIVISRFCVFLSMHIIHAKDVGIGVYEFNLKRGCFYLKKSFQCFFLQAFASLYTTFNVVLVGFWFPSNIVAVYSSAEKLIRAGLGFIGQASIGLFPYIVKREKGNRLKQIRIMVFLSFLFLGFIGVIFVHLLSQYIIPWFFSGKLNGAIEILNIMSWAIPAISAGNIIAFQYMLVEGYEKSLNKIVVFFGVVSLVFSFCLVPSYGVNYMAWIWVCVEWGILFLLLSFVFMKYIEKN